VKRTLGLGGRKNQLSIEFEHSAPAKGWGEGREDTEGRARKRVQMGGDERGALMAEGGAVVARWEGLVTGA
jgi:hypothetical protein